MPAVQEAAAQACEACRKSKRKCTKELPQCSSCLRLKKTCVYIKYFAVDQALEQNGDALSILTKTSVAATGQHQSFPNSYFLDRHLFSPLDQQFISQRAIPLSSEACKQVQQDADTICASYFATTHSWLPILSETHFRADLRSVDTVSQAWDSLLLFCMDLSSSSLTKNPSTYQTAQAACSAAITSGAVSLRLIQSLVLLAAFEIGNAIYPAAYLTVGTVTRLAAIVGLRSTKYSKQPSSAALESWRLREEKRRLWWAIFLLDRIINIGNAELQFVTPDPTSSDMLPTNDLDWDEGRMGPNEAFLSTQRHLLPVNGSFAKTVQAAYMLGKVLRHVGPEHQHDLRGGDLLEEAIQINKVLVAMNRCFEDSLHHETMQKRMSWSCKLNAMSLCATARSLLYSHYATREPIAQEDALLTMELYQDVTEGLDQLLSSTVPILVDMNRQSLAEAGEPTFSARQQAASISPLCAHFLYQASKLLVWRVRERHDAHLHRQLREAIRVLHAMGEIWKVGESYMRLLKQSKVLEQVGWSD